MEGCVGVARLKYATQRVYNQVSFVRSWWDNLGRLQNVLNYDLDNLKVETTEICSRKEIDKLKTFCNYIQKQTKSLLW